MKIRKDIIRAAIKLATSFDGQRVVYANDPKRAAILRDKIYRGPSQDALAFKTDMSAALGMVEGGRIRRRRLAGSESGKSAGGAKAITA